MKTLLIIFSLTVTAFAELPNILWITSEDNAAHWLGCYGNQQASTPRLDQLAAGGIRFTRAYSNAPVCAVARSTILNGAYAISMGTQHMRSRHPIPASFRSYVSHLREIGYYCTNNSKTDYNFKGNDAAIWDECSGKAHYRKRPKDKPFMAVFNLTVTHESNLFPRQVVRNRKKGIIPETPRIAPADITLPPSQPDLPEMRSDAAIYHDCITAMDRQVGKLLDELDKQGLADNTIIFYYSDHGGAMARGKRYLEDSGVRIPMIVHLPEKWRHLSPFAPGSVADEPLAFVDLAPTVLSLAGKATPASMQGRAFLGKHRAAPREFEILFGDRFDENPGMRRAITDGDFKYIRCFSPNQPGAPYSSYAMGQPSWKAWKDAAAGGKLKGYHLHLWQAPQPVEQLFDLRSDPWEIHNLATKPELAQRLIAMRGKLREIMINTRDTSLVPEEMWKEVAANGTIHHYVAEAGKDHAAWVDLAFMATSGSVTPDLEAAFESTSPVARYWAASACLFHPNKAANLADKLGKLAEDSSPVVRGRAAEALSVIRN
ncbi:MAG: sulfatase-like hydrolase/transferase [Akkermansiaceae bacterium]|nr:sulfatase-like hydrolase/transferase [Akkermansiaceae bacterium]